MDSTGLVNCLNCNKEFKPRTPTHVFCCADCNTVYTKEMYKAKRYGKVREEIKKIKRDEWKKDDMGLMKKFYDIFGKDYCCDICNTTFEENVNDHGVPLHIILKPGITNYKVMD